ncbi:PEP-CTERM sorting domain-containing protein [Denitromonas halophila]|uniref:PEP-CTERM sorting domain-containing protein n=2 Tax=Denitromonas halophila TaxID=1629404 RepID=A0A557R1W9_9RHOO|nr:PEP-CTERM sorting domain-containing protein [Denitromonas halophila]
MLSSGLVAGCLAFGGSANAAISFTFDYSNNTPGAGFLDATYGTDRQNALTAAGNAFSSLFGQYFTNTGNIVLAVSSSDDPNSSTLASAGSAGQWDGVSQGFTYQEVVREKLVTGVDLNDGAADGTVDVNWGQPWHLDLSSDAPYGLYDFYSTVFHEFTHAIGFSSSIGQNGEPAFGAGNLAWSEYDRFLGNKNGTMMINPDYTLNQAAWEAASVGGASPAEGMFFYGANAMAANGGQAVGLYSPTVWSDGSSVSHLDTDNPALEAMMMTHAGPDGPSPRVFSAVEVGILTDLGYTAVTPVPEPETYAMMLAGLGLVGWQVRRRRAA